MPELPEVEVLKKTLTKFLVNSTIKKVRINNASLRYKLANNFGSKLRYKKIKNLTRRSKYLLIHFFGGDYILIHLGMTGFFYLLKPKDKKFINASFYINKKINKKHNHIIMYLKNGYNLIYNDIRRFGFMKYYKKSTRKSNIFLIKLGPEPLSKKFNASYLESLAKKRNILIKSLLMNQKIVSGLGNIYVNEALYYSKINPLLLCNKIDKKKLIVLIKNIKKILKTSIKFGGSSIKNYINIAGNKGSFQQKFKVYNRANLKCKNCEGIIKKVKILQRATFYCNTCQK